MHSMNAFAQAALDPCRVLAERGGLLGLTFSSVFPIEVLDAFGLEAAEVPPLSAISTPIADSRIQSFACAYVRAAAEVVLSRGLTVTLLAHASGCDARTALRGVLKDVAPSVELKLPMVTSGPLAARQAQTALWETIKRLQETLGRPLDLDAMREAAGIRERVRLFLSELFEGLSTGRVSARYAYEAAFAAMVMRPKDFLDEASVAKVLEGGGRGIRLLLSGAHMPTIQMIEAMESLGGQVVLDDTCSRGASRRLPEARDIFGAIAQSLLSGMVPDPDRIDPLRVERLVARAREAGVQAAVLLHRKYCDPCAFEAPLILSALRACGIPGLVLEVDRDVGLSERDLGRLQALLESLPAGG